MFYSDLTYLEDILHSLFHKFINIIRPAHKTEMSHQDI